MNPLPYFISHDALSDLDEIWLYTAETWSEQQADYYYGLIVDEIHAICLNIHSGVSLNHIREGYRATKVKSHFIFYRMTPTSIEIIRILHERMDIERRLSD